MPRHGARAVRSVLRGGMALSDQDPPPCVRERRMWTRGKRAWAWARPAVKGRPSSYEALLCRSGPRLSLWPNQMIEPNLSEKVGKGCAVELTSRQRVRQILVDNVCSTSSIFNFQGIKPPEFPPTTWGLWPPVCRLGG